MADKFNLDGFAISESNSVTTDGSITVEGGLNTATGSDSTFKGSFVIGEGGGESLTIASGTVLFAFLPTSDTGLLQGQLWSDGGTLKISAGA